MQSQMFKVTACSQYCW